jgi:hypothetical protein
MYWELSSRWSQEIALPTGTVARSVSEGMSKRMTGDDGDVNSRETKFATARQYRVMRRSEFEVRSCEVTDALGRQGCVHVRPR